jgi:hypothetical protein|tara:strand:+ start:52 stop:657 length:606 start_codon:yes stop_codon:yes gene_type:complete
MKVFSNNHIITDIDGIKVVDNFFTDDCLKALRYRVLFGKHFDKEYPGYLAIDYKANQDYLTDLIVNEIKNKFDLPEFIRGWSFLYLKNTSGVPLHCDPSIVNLNAWISSDESVLDADKNGLHIYKILPPEHWNRLDWNENEDKCFEYIREQKVEPVKIKYKSNRVVFFNGAFFHKTNDVSMKEGFENKRVSYTLLFGNNLE